MLNVTQEQIFEAIKEAEKIGKTNVFSIEFTIVNDTLKMMPIAEGDCLCELTDDWEEVKAALMKSAEWYKDYNSDK